MIPKERGVVSLLTAIIICMLLLVIVIGMTSMMIGELRQATDGADSTQAFYKAEAGAEGAIFNIKDKLATNDLAGIAALTDTNSDGIPDCITVPSVPDVTCLKVSTTSKHPTAAPAKDESIQYDLSGGADAVDEIHLYWNQKDCASGNGVCSDGDPAQGMSALASFPVGTAARNYQGPAVMEVMVAQYKNSGNTSVDLRAAILKPVFGSGPAPANCYQLDNAVPSDTNCSPASGTALPGNVVCTNNVAPSDYNCKATITGFRNGVSDTRYVVRIRPRYAGTHFKLEVTKHDSTLLDVPDQFATIDVTAKTGDVYRRLVEKVKVRSSAFSGLDYALFSDTAICKDLSVKVSATGSTVIPGLCSN